MTIDIGVYPSTSDLPAAAKELLRREGKKDLFCGEQWFNLLVRDAWEGGELLIFAASQTDPESDCVLFAANDGHGRLRGVSNFYTMHYRPVFDDEGAAARSLDAILDAITSARPAWSVIDLPKLIAEDASTIYLQDGLRRRGWITRTYRQFENWYEPTSALSGKDYFASRPSQTRNTIERKWRKANREHRIGITIHTDLDDLEQGISAYERIYGKSWKSAERYPEFITNFLRTYAAEGILRLGVVTVDDIPAAAQIWLVCGGKATIYKLAYDERFTSLSVGSALTKLMFEHVLDKDHVEEVDYGTGSEPYKRDWMSRKRRSWA